MTTLTIIESGMSFGPFPSEACYHIEKSPIYQSIQKGVKISEFLLLRDGNIEASTIWVIEAIESPTIWVVEAKQSAPQDTDKFTDEIRDKLMNGLSLCVAICLRRHTGADSELPELFRKLNLSAVNFRLVLVISGHQKSWLPPLQDALNKKLAATAKVWALKSNPIAVINDEMARKHRLIMQ